MNKLVSDLAWSAAAAEALEQTKRMAEANRGLVQLAVILDRLDAEITAQLSIHTGRDFGDEHQPREAAQ